MGVQKEKKKGKGDVSNNGEQAKGRRGED